MLPRQACYTALMPSDPKIKIPRNAHGALKTWAASRGMTLQEATVAAIELLVGKKLPAEKSAVEDPRQLRIPGS